MALVFVVWTVEEEMLDGFYCDALTFRTGGGLYFADAEEVQI